MLFRSAKYKFTEGSSKTLFLSIFFKMLALFSKCHIGICMRWSMESPLFASVLCILWSCNFHYKNLRRFYPNWRSSAGLGVLPKRDNTALLAIGIYWHCISTFYMQLAITTQITVVSKINQASESDNTEKAYHNNLSPYILGKNINPRIKCLTRNC